MDLLTWHSHKTKVLPSKLAASTISAFVNYLAIVPDADSNLSKRAGGFKEAELIKIDLHRLSR